MTNTIAGCALGAPFCDGAEREKPRAEEENNMLNLALVPVVASLLLVGLMIFVSSRRAHRVAEVRAEVERETASYSGGCAE